MKYTTIININRKLWRFKMSDPDDSPLACSSSVTVVDTSGAVEDTSCSGTVSSDRLTIGEEGGVICN